MHLQLSSNNASRSHSVGDMIENNDSKQQTQDSENNVSITVSQANDNNIITDLRSKIFFILKNS